MKLSLIFAVYNESERLKASLQDLKSFFQRQPLEVELVLVLEPHPTQATLDAVAGAGFEQTTNIKVLQIQNAVHRGRGPSLKVGLDAASGHVLSPMSVDLSTPLADVFSALQEFVMDQENTGFVLGNRRSLKRPRHGQRSGLKKFFDAVEHDKAASLEVPDPTSPFWMIQRELWQKISPNLKFRRWYYTPNVIQALRLIKAPMKSIDTLSHDSTDTRFKWWHAFV